MMLTDGYQHMSDRDAATAVSRTEAHARLRNEDFPGAAQVLAESALVLQRTAIRYYHWPSANKGCQG
jgi:hypothetical protein